MLNVDTYHTKRRASAEIYTRYELSVALLVLCVSGAHSIEYPVHTGTR